jgi:hypothetical protein
MDVYVDGKRVRVTPASAVGKGGEADVFDLGDGTVLKLWKAPDHPDFAGQPADQEAARERLALHQQKMRALPAGLPEGVIAPIALATDRSGKRVIGYTMRFVAGAEVLLRYAEPALRRGGLAAEDAVSALASLHRIVEGLHARGVVIGDFNDLNVLVQDRRAFLIDADSMQFGPFLCRVFTERFIDPQLCDPALSHPVPVRPFSPASDWYAFAVMLMQSLVCVGPHGGVHRPKDPADRVPQQTRALRRITVFDPEVVYPRPALPLRLLPDDLLAELERIFVRDQRGLFPRRLVEELRWTRCAACGVAHLRAVCPSCAFTAKAAVKETTTVRGRVTATRVFSTSGAILAAAVQEGELRWLAHAAGRYVREDGRPILEGPLDPHLVFALQGRATIVGRGAEAAVLAPDRAPERFAVDVFQGQSVLAANARRRYWARGGVLFRGGLGHGGEGVAARLDREGGSRIGDVLPAQTRLWVGPRFGLGFYRAGTLSVGFVFDAERGGLTDTVKLPFLAGEIEDADCVFAEDRAFVLLAARHHGRSVHQCVLVTAGGDVEAAAEAPAGDGSWLGTLRGKCTAGGVLLAPTDAGLVRVEPRTGALAGARSFPDTDPFIDAGTRLYAGRDGLYAVSAAEIHRLTIT